MQVDSGGLGATSSGIAELLIEGAILLLVVWGAGKVIKMIWAALE
jgi:hypothetical protein